MKLSELTKCEAQIGFMFGILLACMSSWIFILFFTELQWYFKVTSSIGEVGIVGSIVLSLSELIKMRRGLVEAYKEMKGGNM